MVETVTLCDPMDYSPPGFSVHGDSPGKNTGVGCHALLQGIFLTQGSNSGLLHCRRILYQVSYLGSPTYWILYWKWKTELLSEYKRIFKCIGCSPSWPNHLPKAPPPDGTTLVIISLCIHFGGIHTFSCNILLMDRPCSSDVLNCNMILDNNVLCYD